MGSERLVRVRTSSEATDGINVAQVLRQEMPLRKLVELMLPVTGPDPARIQAVLHGGSIARRMIRYRWEPLTVAEDELEALLVQPEDRSAKSA